MEVTIEIPDDIARRLELNGTELPRRLLESFAVEGYKSGELSHGQVEKLLGLSWYEVEVFLKKHNAELNYTEEDFEKDMETLHSYFRLSPNDCHDRYFFS